MNTLRAAGTWAIMREGGRAGSRSVVILNGAQGSDAVSQSGKDVISIKGRATSVDAVEIDGKTVVTLGRSLRMAFVKDEVCDDGVARPGIIIDRLRSLKVADIFTFDQKPPDTAPKFDFFYEWDNLAVLKIEGYDHWWNKQIGNDARRMVRKAAKNGVRVEVASLTDELVIGIKSIYDEAPVRQGKPFWHYHKDFETVKRENSTYPDRTEFIAAYHGDELIAFDKIFYTGGRADQIQLIAKLKHRDKAPINALIAKAVEVCASKGISYLTYGKFHYRKKADDSLSDFKKRNGFEKIELPRYYVPLSTKGRIAVALRLYKKPADLLPGFVVDLLLKLREKAYDLRYPAGRRGS